MDLAQLLVRKVIRAFYSTNEILAIEALILHSCLSLDDLTYLINQTQNMSGEVRKLCAGLSQHRFVVVASRPEIAYGKLKPSNKIYFYIDYRQAVDAIKWRLTKLTNDMTQSANDNTPEHKDYVCPRCKAEWAIIDVAHNIGDHGLQCNDCNATLTELAEKQSPAHQQSARMNDQLKFIAELLPRIDKTPPPECTFEKALAAARPIVRAATYEAVSSVPVEAGAAGAAGSKLTAVKGLTDTGPKTLHVSITNADADAEKEELKRKREEMLKRNQLPTWMLESSVPTTSITSAAANGTNGGGSSVPGIKLEFEGHVKDEDDEPSVKRVKLEPTDDDDDELEFEDVV